MMQNGFGYISSSIGKKQIVAATGLFLITFLVIHLAGNLFFYAGPAAFNAYAKKLASLRPALSAIEGLLAVTFLIHITLTALLVTENIKARRKNYRHVHWQGERSLAVRLMPYTGTIILAFVIWHLLDFTLSDHEGVRSMVNGKSLGLYGVVYHSFSNPMHSTFYIIAMIAIGFHLTHAIQSVFQTFGFYHKRYTPLISAASGLLGMTVAAGFSSIPIYVLIRNL